MKYVVELTKTQTTVSHWTIEANSAEEAEELAAKRLEETGEEPEEEDVSFSGWEVTYGMTEESDEQEG